MQKSIVFLYTNNKLLGREIKKIPFIIASEKNAYINLIKEVSNSYLENYKKLRKYIEGNTNEWKDRLCSWLKQLIFLI